MSLASHRIVINGGLSGIGTTTAIAFQGRSPPRPRPTRHQGAGRYGPAAAARWAGSPRCAASTAPTPRPSRRSRARRALLGSIDLWLSCEGVGVLGRYDDVPMADHARVIDVNLVGHMNDLTAAPTSVRLRRSEAAETE